MSDTAATQDPPAADMADKLRFPAGFDYLSHELAGLLDYGQGKAHVRADGDPAGKILFVVVFSGGRIERVWADEIGHDEDAARTWLAEYETARFVDVAEEMGRPQPDNAIRIPPGPAILHGWMGTYGFDGNRFRQLR